MKKVTFYAILAAFILAACLGIMTRTWLKERKERIRVEANQNELLADKADLSLVLKRKELQLVINQDSFLKFKNYSARRINELIKAKAIVRIDTIVKLNDKYVYLSGDTVYKIVKEGIYNDGWNIILNIIEEDSIRNNVIVYDSLYFINQWSRKWFLGKRHDKWELKNRNPKANYGIEYQIKKTK